MRAIRLGSLAALLASIGVVASCSSRSETSAPAGLGTDVASAIHLEAVQASDASTDDISAYLSSHYYDDSDIQYSFLTKYNEQIDCIPFSAQHSVKALQKKGITLDPKRVPPAPPFPPEANPPIVPPALPFNGALDVQGAKLASARAERSLRSARRSRGSQRRVA